LNTQDRQAKVMKNESFMWMTSSMNGVGAGVALRGPKGEVLHYALHLLFPVINNTVEYEAMIAGLRITKEVGAREVNLFSDSQLVVRQINDEARVLDSRLERYKGHLTTLITDFEKVKIQHVPHSKNTQADTLSKLAASGNLDEIRPIIVLKVPHPSVDLPQVLNVADGSAKEEWYSPICRFLTKGELPADKLEGRKIRKLAPMYVVRVNEIYKQGYLESWLKCVAQDKAREMLAEVHEGICGSHQGAKTLAKRIIWAGLYWPTIKSDAATLVRKCEKCQFNSKISRVLPYEMISISSVWPFDLWGINILGTFPTAVQQRKYILVVAEYFTKWVEAEALASISSKLIQNFIWRNIICRFGLPHAIVSDNGTQFASQSTVEFLSGLGIKNNFASLSHPAFNGLVEVTNRTIFEGLKKKVEENKSE
jgi:ribonuclease HI